MAANAYFSFGKKSYIAIFYFPVIVPNISVPNVTAFRVRFFVAIIVNFALSIKIVNWVMCRRKWDRNATPTTIWNGKIWEWTINVINCHKPKIDQSFKVMKISRFGNSIANICLHFGCFCVAVTRERLINEAKRNVFDFMTNSVQKLKVISKICSDLRVSSR